MPVPEMPASGSIDARIGDVAASADEAIDAAARLLAHARYPVIAGLATDVAGAEAAAELAAQIGGVLDHMGSATLLRDLQALRESGWLATTPLQVRARADVVLLLGAITAADLGLEHGPQLPTGRNRRIIALGASDTAEQRSIMLGALRASVAGRPNARGTPGRDALDDCAAALKSAHYAVIAWSAADFDELAVHMICGLIDDLNAGTRCAGLPVPAAGNAAGVAQALAWRTGFPTRVVFGRQGAQHDPWRYDAARLVAAGEADAVLWIGAIPGAAPEWARPVPTVALAAGPAAFAMPADVTIAVGEPGVDHDGVLFDPGLGALAFAAARAPSARPSVGSILPRIAAAIAARPAA